MTTNTTIAQALPTVKKSVGNQLIQTINARDLHAWLESKQDFSNWITTRIGQYEFEQNIDFIVFNKVIENPLGTENKGGRPRKEYHITLDMAKELSMVERNAKGKEARKYFIACEQALINNLTSHKKDTNYLIHNIVISLKEAVRGQTRVLNKIATLHGQSLDLQAQTLAILDKQTTRRRYRPANCEDFLAVNKMLREGKSFAFISDSLGISKNSVYNIKHGILTVGEGSLLVRADIKTKPESTTNINIQA